MARIVGTEGTDWLNGTVRADQIYGFGADDQLFGNNGNDRVSGGPGSDYLEGEGGNDVLIGGSGNDRLYGDYHQDDDHRPVDLSEVGNDTIYGGTGADIFNFSHVVADGVADTIRIDDFRPEQGDKIISHVFATWQSGEDSGAGLFDAFDTNHDGVIKGDGSDAYSGMQGTSLVLHNWEDTVVLANVQQIAHADWIVG